jgi:hypothetical protein
MKKLIAFSILMWSFQYVIAQDAPWTPAQAQKWYKHQPWLRGANFIPSTAINQLEMWQKETFDTATIDRELGWAAGIGLNCMRVFLHHAAWQADPVGFKERVRTYLVIAGRHGIKTIFVFFDDCWRDSFRVGPQPLPQPGVHNSGWLQDPGRIYYDEPLLADTLQRYVTDILTAFGHDSRIILWDLYNECGNNGHFTPGLDLLQKVFAWARAAKPEQPLTSCYWANFWQLGPINAFALSHSDVITYHCYETPEVHQSRINMLRTYGRPMLCTEYMARKHNSTFFTIMPLLKNQGIAAINWGLVDGKTQTKYAWDEPLKDGSEPKLWFHEIFRKDGQPYDPGETTFIRFLCTSEN